jgi:VWFA-related protein
LAERARQDLDAVISSAGGEVFHPQELSGIDGIADHVAHDLRNQYTLAWNPSNQKADGAFRQIRVTVNVPGATAKARSGYYADGTGDGRIVH